MKCMTKFGFSTLEAERAKPVEDQHHNQDRLDELRARALNRVSTTAKEVSANGGPAKATPAPAGKRVDRLDHANTPTALHDAYLNALRERGQR